MNDNREVPRKLVILMEEAATREQQYQNIIKELKNEKESMAKTYLEQLREISSLILKNANPNPNLPQSGSQENPDNKFLPVNLPHFESLKNKPRRDYRKTLYTAKDIDQFALHIDISFVYFTPQLDDYLTEYFPESLQIRFELYREKYDSGEIVYSNCNTKEQKLQLLSNKSPFVLSLKHNPVSKNKAVFGCPKYQIVMQPSPHQPKYHLLEKLELFNRADCLNVEVWDSNSQLIFGQFKIPLKQLLYYQKREDSWVQTFDMYSPYRLGIVGKMDVAFVNWKGPLQTPVTGSDPSEKIKVRSNQPIQLNPTMDYDIHSVSEKQRRMLRRINHYKEESIRHGDKVFLNFENDYIQQENQRRRLEQIMKIKQQNKIKMTQQILETIHTRQDNASSPEGKPTYFPVVFTNGYKTGHKFSVRLTGTKDANEFRLVSDSAEWQSLCVEKKFQEPSRYTLIDPKTNTFYLVAGETVTLLFKYLSWSKSRNERNIQMEIVNSQDQSMQKSTFTVVGTEPHVDHCFRVWQFTDAETQIDIPLADYQKFSKYPQLLRYKFYQSLRIHCPA